tara:strand:- start:210 stop:461 length:252 start_codon:yes stop_codon:yes gene_type:complete
MNIDWAKVPEWIDWVSPEANDGSKRCIGWASKPKINKEELRFENWWCEEDDGFWCELPWYVSSFEDVELENFETMVEQRPNAT